MNTAASSQNATDNEHLKFNLMKNESVTKCLTETSQLFAPFVSITEEHKFNLANIDLCNGRHKYFYQSEYVEKLKLFYAAHKLESDSEVWDLSVTTLSDMIRNVTDFTIRNNFLKELNELIYPIRYIPTQKMNPEFQKYQAVYKILANVINMIEIEAIELKQKMDIRFREQTYPTLPKSIDGLCSGAFKNSEKIFYKPKYFEKSLCSTSKYYEIREMYRPPKYFSERTEDWCLMLASLRYEKLTSLQSENKKVSSPPVTQAKSKISVKNKKSKTKLKKGPASGTKTILTITNSAITPKSSVGSIRIEEESEEEPYNYNYNVYMEVFYLRAHGLLGDAIDDITAALETSKIYLEQPSMEILKQLYQCELLLKEAAPRVVSKITEESFKISSAIVEKLIANTMGDENY